jgi:beta-ureidopropionase / N-carbamoyl-L-amino-acid hydrolase
MPESVTFPEIDGERLRALMDGISAFGDTGDGGVHRPAGTTEHGEARDWLRQRFAEHGMRVAIDGIGNLFGILEWAGPDAPLILTGSHLDSQPNGGRFDGAYGVMASLEAITALKAHFAATGEKPRCNFAIVDWMNEEGARYQPSLLGSSVFAGLLDLDYALSRKDGAGKSVREELARTGYLGSDAPPKPATYVEMHVECGGVLEKTGKQIAPFERYWGALKVRIGMTGKQTHTGPTPMEDRHDALLGAAYVITGIRDLGPRAADTLYTSVGRIEVVPNSPNIVPGEAVLFAELRSPEMSVLEWAEAELAKVLDDAAARAGVAVKIQNIDRRPAGRFSESLCRLAEQSAESLGLSRMRIDTIGGHDGIPMLQVCPSVVVAVPSIGGICHNPIEFTPHEDLVNGTQVLVRMLWQLDRAGGDPGRL